MHINEIPRKVTSKAKGGQILSRRIDVYSNCLAVAESDGTQELPRDSVPLTWHSLLTPRYRLDDNTVLVRLTRKDPATIFLYNHGADASTDMSARASPTSDRAIMQKQI